MNLFLFQKFNKNFVFQISRQMCIAKSTSMPSTSYDKPIPFKSISADDLGFSFLNHDANKQLKRTVVFAKVF